MKKHRLFQELKATTGWALKAQAPRAAFTPDQLPLALDYVVARARYKQPLDDDNLIYGLKAARDSIAAHLNIDDRHFVTGTIDQIRDPDGTGYVDVCITPSVADERRIA